jgi:hypothetical protein
MPDKEDRPMKTRIAFAVATLGALVAVEIAPRLMGG